MLIWYVAELGYFALVGRHRLVRSPEEACVLAELHKARQARRAGGAGNAGDRPLGTG